MYKLGKRLFVLPARCVDFLYLFWFILGLLSYGVYLDTQKHARASRQTGENRRSNGFSVRGNPTIGHVVCVRGANIDIGNVVHYSGTNVLDAVFTGRYIGRGRSPSFRAASVEGADEAFA